MLVFVKNLEWVFTIVYILHSFLGCFFQGNKMKNLNELLNERNPDVVYATTRHYSETEMLGKEAAKKLQVGQASLEDAVVEMYGTQHKAKFYTPLPETFYGNNWGTCFYTNCSKWIVEHKPSGSAIAVLFGLLSQVRYYNYVRVSQAQLAKNLNLSRGAVSESLDFLQKTNVIIPVPESQLPLMIKVKPKVERKWYRVSIDLFWKGKASDIDRCPENYKMRHRERDMEDHEIKTLKDAVEKAEYFLPEI